MRIAFIFLLFLSSGGCVSIQDSQPVKETIDPGQEAFLKWFKYTYRHPNRLEADKWLIRAVELGEADAQRMMANRILRADGPYENYGKTPVDAALRLLEDASKSSGVAATRLGQLYYDQEYGGASRLRKAREAFLRASNGQFISWRYLAKMLHHGEGGAEDQLDAYYYVCLDTSWSSGGKEMWALRRKIEERLSLPQMKEVWMRVDSFLLKESKRTGGRIFPGRFGSLGKKKWKRYLKSVDNYEAQHREKISRSRLRGEKYEMLPFALP